jgi:hypothetical protein
MKLNIPLKLCLFFVFKYLSTSSLSYTKNWVTDQLTNKLITWSRVIPEKLTVLQLGKEFPEFCETQKFISIFIKACH